MKVSEWKLMAAALAAVAMLTGCQWLEDDHAQGSLDVSEDFDTANDDIEYCAQLEPFLTTVDGVSPDTVGIRFPGSFLADTAASEGDQTWNLDLTQIGAGIGIEPYNHVFIAWNGHGHPPPMIYDAPHFDFHFHMLAQEVRESVCAADNSDVTQCVLVPTPDEIPFGYAAGPSEPGHGVHWMSVTAPEFMGTPFTTTFVYGSYDGDMVFLEPMVTGDFLQSLQDGTQSFPVEQPPAVGLSGWYPQNYALSYEAGADCYVVELTDLTLRTSN